MTALPAVGKGRAAWCPPAMLLASLGIPLGFVRLWVRAVALTTFPLWRVKVQAILEIPGILRHRWHEGLAQDLCPQCSCASAPAESAPACQGVDGISVRPEAAGRAAHQTGNVRSWCPLPASTWGSAALLGSQSQHPSLGRAAYWHRAGHPQWLGQYFLCWVRLSAVHSEAVKRPGEVVGSLRRPCVWLSEACLQPGQALGMLAAMSVACDSPCLDDVPWLVVLLRLAPKIVLQNLQCLIICLKLNTGSDIVVQCAKRCLQC